MHLLILGIIFALCGILLCYSEWSFYIRAFRVKGVVIESTQQESSTPIEKLESDSPTYRTVIEFEFDGMKRQITDSYGGCFAPEVGQEVTIAINPKDYRDVRVYFAIKLFAGLIFFILGLIAIIISFHAH